MPELSDFVPTIFNANAKPGAPMSYEALQMRRKIAEQLMGKRSPFPKTLGEGLTYAGERIADVIDWKGLQEAEREHGIADAAVRNRIANADVVEPSPVAAAAASRDPGAGLPAPPAPSIVQPAPAAPPTSIAQLAPATSPQLMTPRRPAPVVTNAAVRPAPYDPAGTPTLGFGENPFSDPGGGPDGSYAGLPGNARNIFQRPIRSPGGAMLAVPEQPPPGKFTTARGLTPTPREAVTQALVAQQQPDETVIPPEARATQGAPQPAPAPITPVPGSGPPIVRADIPSLAAQAAQDTSLPASQRTPPAAQDIIPPHPGPLRARPALPVPTPTMRSLERDANNPNLPPSTQAMAAAKLKEMTHRQNMQYEADTNDWINHRTQQQHELNAHTTAVQNMPEARRKQYAHDLEVEAKLAERANDPVKAAMLRAQLVEITQKIRKPDRFNVGETPMQQVFDESTGQWGPATLVPGVPRQEPKLTAEQAHAVEFVRTAVPDMDRLDNELNSGMVLAKSPGSSLGTTVGGVVGMGNLFRTQEYADAENTLSRFKGGMLKIMSGGAVTASEAERNLPAFIPRYKDSDAEVYRKAARRRDFINAVADTAGAGGEAIDRGKAAILKMNGELAPVRVTSPEEVKTLRAGQRFVVVKPDGSEHVGVKPWPKDLLPPR